MIVEVAEHLFANEGYTSTSIDDITKKCDITKAAVYYYFKNKGELYAYILNNNFTQLADAIEREVDAKSQIDEKFKSYVCTMAMQFKKNEHIASLLMREMANGGRDMPADTLSHMLRTFKVLSSIIKDGVEKKIFTCVEPMFMQMMIVGSLSFLFTSTQLRKKAQNEIDSSLKTLTQHSFEEAADKISHTLLNALKE